MKEQIVRQIIDFAGSLPSNQWRSGDDLPAFVRLKSCEKSVPVPTEGNVNKS